jgi:hypothetical protein
MAKAKKQRAGAAVGRAASGRAASGNDARTTLAALIRKKEAAVTDGALQIVIAVASVTTLVTVDTTQQPPVFDPPDLGSLTFGDPRVGLSDQGVAIFKANLKILLPQIAGDIDQIPDNANLNIGDVARFVQLSLQTA